MDRFQNYGRSLDPLVKCQSKHLWMDRKNKTCDGWHLWKHMWQSRVEIKGYSVVYFDQIAGFEEPYQWTFVKGGAHTRFIDVWTSNESTKQVWAPPFMEVHRNFSNTVLQMQRCNQNIWQNNTQDCHMYMYPQCNATGILLETYLLKTDDSMP